MFAEGSPSDVCWHFENESILGNPNEHNVARLMEYWGVFQKARLTYRQINLELLVD